MPGEFACGKGVDMEGENISFYITQVSTFMMIVLSRNCAIHSTSHFIRFDGRSTSVISRSANNNFPLPYLPLHSLPFHPPAPNQSSESLKTSSSLS